MYTIPLILPELGIKGQGSYVAWLYHVRPGDVIETYAFSFGTYLAEVGGEGSIGGSDDSVVGGATFSVSTTSEDLNTGVVTYSESGYQTLIFGALDSGGPGLLTVEEILPNQTPSNFTVSTSGLTLGVQYTNNDYPGPQSATVQYFGGGASLTTDSIPPKLPAALTRQQKDAFAKAANDMGNASFFLPLFNPSGGSVDLAANMATSLATNIDPTVGAANAAMQTAASITTTIVSAAEGNPIGAVAGATGVISSLTQFLLNSLAQDPVDLNYTTVYQAPSANLTVPNGSTVDNALLSSAYGLLQDTANILVSDERYQGAEFADDAMSAGNQLAAFNAAMNAYGPDLQAYASNLGAFLQELEANVPDASPQGDPTLVQAQAYLKSLANPLTSDPVLANWVAAIESFAPLYAVAPGAADDAIAEVESESPNPATGSAFALIGQVVTNLSNLAATPLDPLTITGTLAGQGITDQQTANPFANVTIADSDASAQTVTLTVTLSNPAAGALTDPSASTDGGSYVAATGVYTVSGSASAVTSAIDGLVFTPAANFVTPGWQSTTGFTIAASDGADPNADDATTAVTTIYASGAPRIAATAAVISDALDALQATANLPIIVVTDWSDPVVVTSSQWTADAAAIKKIVGSHELQVTDVAGQSYSTFQYDFVDGVYVEADYTFAAQGQVYSSYDYDYSPGGAFIGSKFFYLDIVDHADTDEEVDYDASGRVTRVAFTGVVDAPYSAYEYDYVGGVFAGSKFSFTTVPAGAAYSSYEVDYDNNGAFVGDKFFFSAIAGQPYSAEEIDFDASGALSQVTLSGFVSTPYSSLELEYSAGAYQGYKAFYAGTVGQSFKDEEIDVSASGALEKVVYSGMTSTPYSSVEQDYSGGSLADTIYFYTDVAGQSYYAYQVEESASGAPLSETFDLTSGAHTLLALSSGQTLTSLGEDKMTGDGATTFLFAPIYGADTITNFNSADTIALPKSEFSDFNAMMQNAQNSGANVVITAADGDTLTLKNMNTTTLAGLSANFTFHG